MVKYQWTVFWANLTPAKGSEQAGMRPVLVVSSEPVNQALPIVAVLPLTSFKEDRKIYPTEALLPAQETGLPKDSLAMAHQIRTIAKSRLSAKSGAIAGPERQKIIKNIIKTYLDLAD